MSRRPRAAVLGAGITGSATALFLARAGLSVELFDAAPAPFTGASRWNEGKIHLGHLYAGDPGLDTARSVLPGGLAFRGLVEELLDGTIEPAITRHADTYLVHRNSVASVEATAGYFEAVTRMACEHPDAARYLVDLRGACVRPLSCTELDTDYDTRDILAGFRVPERSVSTNWIADRFVAALDAEPRVVQRLDTRILGVQADGDDRAGPYRLATSDGRTGPYDFVVNALWEGRIGVDATLGLRPPGPWTHRFRQSVFLSTRDPVELPSTVIATGPFGDVKNYDGRSFYLSWYPAGLLAEGSDLEPPAVARPDADHREAIADETLGRLARTIPAVGTLRERAAAIHVEGGWVYAVGNGSLADPAATLHRRDRTGIHRRGRYLSVDTGKYSVAPTLARTIAAFITERT